MVEMIMRPTKIKLCAKAMKRTSYLQVGDLEIMNVRNLRLASTRAGNKPILVRQVPATQHSIRPFSPPFFVFPSGSPGCSCNLIAPWGKKLNSCGPNQPSGAEDFLHTYRTTLGMAKRRPKKDMLGEPGTARERSKWDPGYFRKKEPRMLSTISNPVAESTTRRPRLQAACGSPTSRF